METAARNTPRVAKLTADAIAGDAEQPGPECRRIIQPGQRAEDSQPDFLEQIVRPFKLIAEHFADVETEAVRIAAQQFFERRLIADLAA